MRIGTEGLVGIAVLGTLIAASPAQAGPSYRVHWRDVGSSTHSAINLDGKDDPASAGTLEGRGTFGPALSQFVFEPTPKPGLERCPSDAIVEYGIVQSRFVRTFKSSGDQVFLLATEGFSCIFLDPSDPTVFPVTSEATYVVTGGTGRFAHATGTLTGKGLKETVSFLEMQGNFNNIVSVWEGIIVLDDGN